MYVCVSALKFCSNNVCLVKCVVLHVLLRAVGGAVDAKICYYL
jgi:hypothetical protein